MRILVVEDHQKIASFMQSALSSAGYLVDVAPRSADAEILSAELRQAGLDAFNKGQCANCHPAAGHQEGPASDIGTGESVRAPNLGALNPAEREDLVGYLESL